MKIPQTIDTNNDNDTTAKEVSDALLVQKNRADMMYNLTENIPNLSEDQQRDLIMSCEDFFKSKLAGEDKTIDTTGDTFQALFRETGGTWKGKTTEKNSIYGVLYFYSILADKSSENILNNNKQVFDTYVHSGQIALFLDATKGKGSARDLLHDLDKKRDSDPDFSILKRPGDSVENSTDQMDQQTDQQTEQQTQQEQTQEEQETQTGNNDSEEATQTEQTNQTDQESTEQNTETPTEKPKPIESNRNNIAGNTPLYEIKEGDETLAKSISLTNQSADYLGPAQLSVLGVRKKDGSINFDKLQNHYKKQGKEITITVPAAQFLNKDKEDIVGVAQTYEDGIRTKRDKADDQNSGKSDKIEDYGLLTTDPTTDKLTLQHGRDKIDLNTIGDAISLPSIYSGGNAPETGKYTGTQKKILVQYKDGTQRLVFSDPTKKSESTKPLVDKLIEDGASHIHRLDTGSTGDGYYFNKDGNKQKIDPGGQNNTYHNLLVFYKNKKEKTETQKQDDKKEKEKEKTTKKNNTADNDNNKTTGATGGSNETSTYQQDTKANGGPNAGNFKVGETLIEEEQKQEQEKTDNTSQGTTGKSDTSNNKTDDNTPSTVGDDNNAENKIKIVTELTEEQEKTAQKAIQKAVTILNNTDAVNFGKSVGYLRGIDIDRKEVEKVLGKNTLIYFHQNDDGNLILKKKKYKKRNASFVQHFKKSFDYIPLFDVFEQGRYSPAKLSVLTPEKQKQYIDFAYPSSTLTSDSNSRENNKAGYESAKQLVDIGVNDFIITLPSDDGGTILPLYAPVDAINLSTLSPKKEKTLRSINQQQKFGLLFIKKGSIDFSHYPNLQYIKCYDPQWGKEKTQGFMDDIIGEVIEHDDTYASILDSDKMRIVWKDNFQINDKTKTNPQGDCKLGGQWLYVGNDLVESINIDTNNSTSLRTFKDENTRNTKYYYENALLKQKEIFEYELNRMLDLKSAKFEPSDWELTDVFIEALDNNIVSLLEKNPSITITVTGRDYCRNNNEPLSSFPHNDNDIVIANKRSRDKFCDLTLTENDEYGPILKLANKEPYMSLLEEAGIDSDHGDRNGYNHGKYSFLLARLRAESVQNYLIEKGINKNRINIGTMPTYGDNNDRETINGGVMLEFNQPTQ